MPRNTRNFWLSLDVDGKKTRVETGPRSKDGGFELTIKIRNEGSVSSDSIDITGRVDPETGALSVQVVSAQPIALPNHEHHAILLTGKR